jgi:hypothetical protein
LGATTGVRRAGRITIIGVGALGLAGALVGCELTKANPAADRSTCTGGICRVLAPAAPRADAGGDAAGDAASPVDASAAPPDGATPSPDPDGGPPDAPSSDGGAAEEDARPAEDGPAPDAAPVGSQRD